MANQTTQPYKATFSGSVGAGMGSLFSPGGRKYYILEHKVSSRYHKAGESQEIIVDQIELGRDSRCQVRFDENFSTVSRRHAAIVRDGDNWKLVQISQTNTTLLNGRPVRTEWYLQNGDEIQLSMNGPKLGFIVPTGNKATVGSIGLSRRLSLFRQQALTPYKYAITALSCILLFCITVGSYVIWDQGKTIKNNEKILAEAVVKNEKNETLITEQKKILKGQTGLLDSISKEVIIANKKAEEAMRRAKEVQVGTTGVNSTVDMSSCHPYVFHITATAMINGKAWSGWLGTGFMLDDGKFVTARHVTTPYYSNSYVIQDGKVYCGSSIGDSIGVFKELLLNVMYMAGDAEIVYKVVSPKGSYTFSSKNVSEEGAHDQVHTLQEPFIVYIRQEDGTMEQYTIPAGTQIRAGALGAGDFAYIQTDQRSGLKANRDASVNMKQGTQLYILGYPNGWGQGNPILSTAICSQNGLSDELGGTIMASNNNTEGGNSGGPIFVKGESDWEVVAIVSGRNEAKGRFVPIAVIP